MGAGFKGVYNLYTKHLLLFTPHITKISDDQFAIDDLASPELDKRVGAESANHLRKDIELIDSAYEPFDKDLYSEGYLAPVFFGSAINNFGVKELLDTFITIAPSPLSRQTETREVKPEENDFSGFVFKIHANIDPKHRDRIAFCRIVSGKFERNKFFYHTRLDKKLRFSSPTSFMANEKAIVEEAYPGDVVGLYDTGNFKIGDTLTEGEKLTFQGIPSFSPEIFKELINKDPFKTKQLEKGVRQLSDEGVAQLFIKQPGNVKIIGTVGELQFEVIQFRLLHEYSASCTFQPLRLYKAFWFTSKDKAQMNKFISLQAQHITFDKDDRPVFMAESEWHFKVTREVYPALSFHITSENK
jgi:peptide chain release factor 3